MVHKSGNDGFGAGRILLIVCGLGMVVFGVLFSRSGVWAYVAFSQRFGRPTVVFSAEWIGLGVVFFLLGALPWSNWLERRNRHR